MKKATWNYIAAGHGKNAADEIGSNIKEMCDRHVTHGHDILCANDMVNYIDDSNSKINAFCVSNEDIKNFDSYIVDNLKPIQNTLKIHQIMWSKLNSNTLSFNYLSCSLCNVKTGCKHYRIKSTVTYNPNKINRNAIETENLNTPSQSTQSFKVGEWVVVIYDTWYPGKIQKISKISLSVKFLERSGKIFFWPNNCKVYTLVATQILCKINEPSTISKQNFFTISDQDCKKIFAMANSCIIYEP